MLKIFFSEIRSIYGADDSFFVISTHHKANITLVLIYIEEKSNLQNKFGAGESFENLALYL